MDKDEASDRTAVIGCTAVYFIGWSLYAAILLEGARYDLGRLLRSLWRGLWEGDPGPWFFIAVTLPLVVVIALLVAGLGGRGGRRSGS